MVIALAAIVNSQKGIKIEATVHQMSGYAGGYIL